ncbi:MAG: T9SS type A sorting domain-containing protein [Flavobacteriales bacterium]|jgi:hypothetical protein|nr:T9SS type A sorting domain-containing protein [Flavobacteriales bacterium]
MDKRIVLKLALGLASFQLYGQSFREIEILNGEGTIYGEVLWIDSQNDSIKEAVVSGASDNYDHYASLVNNTEGDLSVDSVNQLEGVSLSSLDKADFNGDGYMDIIMTGYNGTENVVNLYTNNTDGSYSKTLTDMIGTTNGRIRSADFNNDNLADVIITGVDTSSTYSARVYLQNAQGGFVLKANTLMENYFGDITILDGDQDGDLDVLLTGFDLSYAPNAKYYLNDGTGVFTENANAGFGGAYFTGSSVADYDNDGDEDVLITGFNSSFSAETFLYENDGNGIFTKLTTMPFEGLYFGTADFVDTDLDGDYEVFITGQDASSTSKSLFYRNDNGVYTLDQVISDTIMGLSISSTAWEDYDKDNDLDLIYSGFDTTSSRQIRVYVNELYEPTYEYASIVNEEKGNLVLFPNPCEEQFTILTENRWLDNATFMIYDLSGKIVVSGKIKSPEQSVSMSGVDAGVYIVHAIVDGKTFIQKVTVK